MKRFVLAAALLGAAAPVPADEVAFELRRPALAGWELGTVGIVSARGTCPDLLASKVRDMLSRHGVTAGPVDVRRLTLERRVTLPAFLGPSELRSLAKHVDADTLLVLRTSECTYPQRSFERAHPKTLLGMEDKKRWEYVTTTRMTLRATVQAVSLRGARISRAIPVETSPEVAVRSRTSYPSEPSPDQFRAEAVDRVVGQVTALLAPWTLKVEVPVHDDKECGLKASAAALRARDATRALELARAGDAQCQADPRSREKHRQRARLNLAAALVATGDTAAALPLFEQAVQAGAEEARPALAALQRETRLAEAARGTDEKIASAALAP